MSDEEWRDVPGWEGRYQVSDMGRVRSVTRRIRTGKDWVRVARGKVLALYSNEAGYQALNLKDNGYRKRESVHSLVLYAFIGPRPDGLICCHNDGNPSNNTLPNLRWDTYASNSQDTLRHGNHPGQKIIECPYGHPYDDENTNWVDGHRSCRTCRRARDRAPERRAKLNEYARNGRARARVVREASKASSR